MSVAAAPRSEKVEIVVMPEPGSLHTILSGSTISAYSARIVYRLPSASLTMTASNTPPGRGSTLMVASGVLIPAGPQKWVRCSGSIMQRNTSSLGASNARVEMSSPASGVMSFIGLSYPFLRRCSLDVAHVLVELVEPLLPDPPVLLDPADGRVQHRTLQVAGPELGATGPGDEPALLEHLQVLGDARKGHVERRGQLVHRGVPPGQASDDRPPGRVRQGREGGVELILGHGHGRPPPHPPTSPHG